MCVAVRSKAPSEGYEVMEEKEVSEKVTKARDRWTGQFSRVFMRSCASGRTLLARAVQVEETAGNERGLQSCAAGSRRRLPDFVSDHDIMTIVF